MNNFFFHPFFAHSVSSDRFFLLAGLPANTFPHENRMDQTTITCATEPRAENSVPCRSVPGRNAAADAAGRSTRDAGPARKPRGVFLYLSQRCIFGRSLLFDGQKRMPASVVATRTYIPSVYSVMTDK